MICQPVLKIPIGRRTGRLRVAGDPLGVGICRVFVAQDADVDRSPNAGAVQRVNLFGQQIQRFGQSRMPLQARRFVIKMPVMALGKDGDAVDMRRLERGREFSRVELRADIQDVGAGVEIEVDLPAGKFAESHQRSLESLLPMPRRARLRASTLLASRLASATSMICFWNSSVRCWSKLWLPASRLPTRSLELFDIRLRGCISAPAAWPS